MRPYDTYEIGGQDLRKTGTSFRTGKLACLIRNLFEIGCSSQKNPASWRAELALCGLTCWEEFA